MIASIKKLEDQLNVLVSDFRKRMGAKTVVVTVYAHDTISTSVGLDVKFDDVLEDCPDGSVPS